MKKLKGILVLILLLALLASPIAVLASDISGARYYGTIIVTNNSTATTNVAVNCTISTSALIDGGYLSASANNCVVRNSAGADLPFMPSVNASYPWCIWVPSIGTNASTADILYTANSTGGEIRYFPTTDGMTTPDSPSMELGDNFSVEQSGWWDTDYDASVNKTAVYKEDAFWVFIGSSENITAEIIVETPTGDNDVSADWTNDSNARDNNIATYATGSCPINDWGGFLELTNSKVPTSAIRFYLDTATDADITQVDLDAYYGGAWVDVYQGVFVEDAWIEKTLGGNYFVSNVQIRFYNNTGVGAREAELAEVEYVTDLQVSATGIASGEYTVTTNGTANYPAWATGDVLHFDGTAASNVNAGPRHNNVPELWVSLWFKLDDNFSSASPADLYFAGKVLIAADRLLYKLESGDGKLYFLHISGGATVVQLTSSETSWMADTWYHVIISISGFAGGTQRLLVDNSLSDSDTQASANTPNGGDFIIGDQDDPGGVTGWKGEIQNVIVGIDDLTPTEEEALYNGVAPADAVNYWYIDEGTGIAGLPLIIDYGTGGNDGTRDTNTSWTTSTYTTGKTGRLCDFNIQVDNDRWGSNLKGASVPNTSANWTFLQNNVMPYMEYHTISVNLTQRQYIDWEYDTTFQDSSAFDNDATPTFRTTSSDPDVSAVLTSFLPVSEAQAPAYALADAPPFIETVPTIVSGFDTTPPAGTFPLALVITAVANATSTPPQLPLLIIAIFITLAFSLTVSAIMRRYGSGSLIPKIIAITAVWGVFIALENFGIDFWMTFVFLVIAIALAMGSKQVGWQ